MNLLKTNKLLRFCFALCALSGLLFQFFAPFFAVLFFAVSPMNVFSGVKAERVTVENGYICPMGIEWKPGTEKILARYGFNHDNHAAHTAPAQSSAALVEDNPHAHHDMPQAQDHKADHGAATPVKDMKQSPAPHNPLQDCLLSVIGQFSLFALAALQFAGLVAAYYFGKMLVAFFSKRRRFVISALYRLFPPKNAPPLRMC